MFRLAGSVCRAPQHPPLPLRSGDPGKQHGHRVGTRLTTLCLDSL